MKKMLNTAAYLLVASALSCTPVKNAAQAAEPITHAEKGKVLLGYHHAADFKNPPYAEWYNTEHDSYQTDAKGIEALKQTPLSDYNLLVFVGSWCPDSHREFPRLMKILENLNFPENQLEIVALDRNFEEPGGAEIPYNIHRVATIIVKKGNMEIGRIVEYPASGFLERDLLRIIEAYRNSPKP